MPRNTLEPIDAPNKRFRHFTGQGGVTCLITPKVPILTEIMPDLSPICQCKSYGANSRCFCGISSVRIDACSNVFDGADGIIFETIPQKAEAQVRQ